MCGIDYKSVSKTKIVFGYYCSSIDNLINEEARLVDMIRDYCDETNKKIETEFFTTPWRDKYVLEIRVYK